MLMYICTHIYLHRKVFCLEWELLEDCVAYSSRLLAETGSISSNFKPGAGFKSSLIFCVQPKGQVCLSSGPL